MASKAVNEFLENLRDQMEARINDPSDFGFFYDPPSAYLAQPVLGDGLHQRIMSCKNDEVNPVSIFQRLLKAMAGDANEREMENQDFDWGAAKKRYNAERQNVNSWLASPPD